MGHTSTTIQKEENTYTHNTSVCPYHHCCAKCNSTTIQFSPVVCVCVSKCVYVSVCTCVCVIVATHDFETICWSWSGVVYAVMYKEVVYFVTNEYIHSFISPFSFHTTSISLRMLLPAVVCLVTLHTLHFLNFLVNFLQFVENLNCSLRILHYGRYDVCILDVQCYSCIHISYIHTYIHAYILNVIHACTNENTSTHIHTFNIQTQTIYL